MKIEELKKELLVESKYWNEPVIIKSFEIMGNNINIFIEYKNSKIIENQIISFEELEEVKVINENKYFVNSSRAVFLALEGLRYRYASLYDPLLAMNISKVDPLPHQIEAVYGYVLKLPRIRFLIADDPGAGKTIMAGLIIKELKLRNLIKNILIVAPGHLKTQWVRELKEKFDENFIILDRNLLNTQYYENVWQKENQIVCSIDFIKQEDIRLSLSNCFFDLIIVDEAHKMAAYRYSDNIRRTDRYALGEVLSEISNHLLFLTATPHKGDPENFRLFLDLLEKGFFATNDMIKDSIENKDNPLFIRRIKEDLKDFEGKPLFLPRNVKTVTFNYGKDSPLEKELYNELSKYVENQYNISTSKQKNRNIVFALVILQRRFASSVYSLLCSLKRRKQKLEELASYFNLFENDFDSLIRNIDEMEEIEEYEENERWKIEEKLETLSASTSKEELEEEINTLNDLIKKAERIINEGHEIKLKELKNSLDELSRKIKEGENRKILIFTESKDTLSYLEKRISQWGYKVNSIHGGMNLEERIKAEAIFKNETDVLVATEAAGEGINLQFCNLMINYDIPWNPNRLEQRMGRIHRYGQKREVFVHNLVAEDTREGAVLNSLFKKIEQIKEHLGNDKVFDVLGDIISNKDFSQALTDAAVNARSIDEIMSQIENIIKVDEEYINKIKEELGESLATHYINYTMINDMAQKAKEYRLIPEYTQNFFIKAMDFLKGKYKKINEKEISIEQIPYEIKKIANEDEFKKKFGILSEKYPKVTFDKQYYIKNNVNDFISFGHPLFEAVLKYIENNFLSYIYNGALFYDPDGKLNGYILYYEGEIKDGTNKVAGKKIFSYYIDTENNIKPISPSIIWDIIESENPEEENIDIEDFKKKVLERVIEDLNKYRQEIFNERKKQAQIKEKYGKKSLEYIICKLDEDLLNLEDRLNKGENVDLVINNKKARKKYYEQSLKDLEKLIEAEQSLSIKTPRFLGIIRIKPIVGKLKDMKSDEEIEKIGMKIAIRHEIKSGRIPEDVSLENLGFDIRSKDSNGNIRYIEVKARAEKGDISLTKNEWFKAVRFGQDYYLYVIYDAATDPKLHIIQNPAENLKFFPEFAQIRYIATKDEIEQKGIKNE